MELSMSGYKVLEARIAEKVKQITFYENHIEVYVAEKRYEDIVNSYKGIIKQLNKDIEEIKEEYRAEEKLKYSKDDVSLRRKI